MDDVVYFTSDNNPNFRATDLRHTKTYLSWIYPSLMVEMIPNFIETKYCSEGVGMDLPEVEKWLLWTRNWAKQMLNPYKGKYINPVISLAAVMLQLNQTKENIDADKEIYKDKKVTSGNKGILGGKSAEAQYRIGKNMGKNLEYRQYTAFALLLPDGRITVKGTYLDYIMDISGDAEEITLTKVLRSTRSGKSLEEQTEVENKIDKKPLLEILQSLLMPVIMD